MSFYASYYGQFRLKDSVPSSRLEEIKRKLSTAFGGSEIDIQNLPSSDSTPSAFLITVSGFEKYREEDLYPVYRELTALLEWADIEFTGEESSIWKHTYENGSWYEQTAEVIYTKQTPLFK